MRAINRLRRWQRHGIDLSGALLLASGLLWLALHYTVGAGAGELPHPLEPWLMRLHGAATMAALFMLGLLAAHHVPHGWRVTHGQRARLQRRLGLALCLLAALLVGSGYALYYLVGEAARPATGLLHNAAGVGMALLLVWHRRSRRPLHQSAVSA
jgi:hypothetical protein